MKKRSFRIYLILTLFWTAGIFLHSAMPAAASNAESGGVLAVVQMILPWITHGVLRSFCTQKSANFCCARRRIFWNLPCSASC